MHFRLQINRRTALRKLATLSAGLGQVSAGGLRLFASPVQDEQGYEAEFPSMGSKINMRWFSKLPAQDKIVDQARKTADDWVAVLSDYDPNSQAMTSCSNADSGNWVVVSKDLWSMIQMCDEWHRWSNGAFDAALGAITRLRRQRKLALASQWEEARRKSGWKLLELDADKRAIRFKTAGVRFDFGAIGKGWVVDRIAEKLVELGIERYVVNASGNMRIGKAPKDSTGWPIAIDVPPANDQDSGTELIRNRISQCGIATSGDRWQRFPNASGEAKGNYTSHILDPTTNKGIAGRQSVTIIAENAVDADAAATATCVRANRNLADWLNVLSEKKPNLEAHVLLQDEDASLIRYISTFKRPDGSAP